MYNADFADCVVELNGKRLPLDSAEAQDAARQAIAVAGLEWAHIYAPDGHELETVLVGKAAP